jgi:hypothetical protein
MALDGDVPPSDEIFFYLVRAVNPCGDGTLGVRSSGVERVGPPGGCP